jgi:hypothetical protein
MALFNKITLMALGAVVTVSSTAMAQEKWSDRITLGGNIRVRAQKDSWEATSTSRENDNLRGRIRFQLTGNMKLSDELMVGTRLSTGGDDTGQARGTNTDMTGFNSRKRFSVDLAYIQYMPMKNLTIQGGKNPFMWWKAGKNFMTISAAGSGSEGVQAKYTHDFGSVSPFLGFGYYSLLDQNSTSSSGHLRGSDVNLIGAQLGVPMKFGDLNATLSAGSFTYTNLKNLTVASVSGSATQAYGNTITSSAFANDYKLTSFGAEVGYNLGFAPISVWTEMTTNSEPSDNNKAMIGGLTLGALKDAGSWAFTYNYRDVQKDAVFGYHNDVTALGGGTNNMGWVARADYRTSKDVTLGLEYQMGSNAGRALTTAIFDVIAAF